MGDVITLDDCALNRLERKFHDMWLPSAPLSLDLVTALDELRDWLNDDHWWKKGSSAGWLALVDDVLAALDLAGAPLLSVLSDTAWPLRDDLAAFRAQLRQDKKGRGSTADTASTATTRICLVRRAERMRDAMESPATLHAAWQALLDAFACHGEEWALDQRQAEFRRIGEIVGHPTSRLVRLVGGVLADSERAVNEMLRDVQAGIVRIRRREPEGTLAGLALRDRLDLIERYLLLPVEAVDGEVWVAVEDAFFDGPSVEVGPVTFWNGAALREAVLNHSADHLPALVRSNSTIFAWLWERRERGANFALARVPVGTDKPSAARSDARDTVRALLVLAEFDEGYSAWRVADRGLLHFVDGDWVLREQLDPGKEPEGPDWARIALNDNTPAALRARAPTLAGKLPLRASTPEVRHVFELLHWHAESRATPGSSRIVLAKRVIERAAGWADVEEDAFTDQQLAIPWARKRTLEFVGETTRVALAALEHGDYRQQGAWLDAHDQPRCIVSGTAPHAVIQTDRALEHLGWLMGHLEAQSDEQRQLERLGALVADGASYADWIDRLREDFRCLRHRYSRHRNAIVHGGPVDEQSVKTILLFVDALAVDTLAVALDGVLAGRNLRTQFKERKQVYDDWLNGLRTSGRPVHELLAVPV